MDSAARELAAVIDPLTVGKAFIMQYYYILCNMPEHLHRFYQEKSKVGRAGQDGVMRILSPLQCISEELKTMSCGDFKSAEITSYDTQESHNGGFILAVTGYFTLNERLRRKFTQTFFLAPQENGYFVLNDMLRFVNEAEAVDAEVGSVKDSETTSPFSAPTGNQGSEQAECVSVNQVCKEMSKPVNNENTSAANKNVTNEEAPDIEITCKEVADDSTKISDPDDGFEDVPKKSYASVLKVTNDKAGVSTGSSPSPKKIPKVQEHQDSSDPFPEQILKEQGYQESSDLSPLVESDAISEAIIATEKGYNQGFAAVADGTSIYVKHLPANATIDMLETEFKQFGAISNGGIQVINQRGFGYPFGFVEFEDADSAQKAIEASPIMIGGQRAYVEEKRSTSRGNRGNRNVVGGRGRGSYGDNYRRGGGSYGDNYRRGGGRRYFNRRGNDYFASINNTC